MVHPMVGSMVGAMVDFMVDFMVDAEQTPPLHSRFLFVRRVRRTFFSSGWCFFYLVTTGWIFLHQLVM